MTFAASRSPHARSPRCPLWFVADQGRMLVHARGGETAFLDSCDLEALGLDPSHGWSLGTTDQRHCMLIQGDASIPVAGDLVWTDLRALFGTLDEAWFWMAARASHLARWDRSHRFCGACGTPLALHPEEWAKVCGGCGQIGYPRISPAVIVSVVDGDRILLARNVRSQRPFFSVLAGFVEPGEDLEGAVHREIREEVGLTVKNLRYFGSQPWPFPDSLMIGFSADYAGGELDPDPSEILEANWFSRHALPEIPPSLSISRQLIDAFIAREPR